MAKFIGRDILLDHIDKMTNIASKELKGLKGEIEVGDFLAKHLPDDTYIISQPVIGKYQPDYLVISPRYGFRIVEVKNWSITSISDVQSNGGIQIYDKFFNPINQLRNHVNNLQSYLVSNHPSLNDPYKQIGYVSIQYGFSKNELAKYTKTWNKSTIEDYYKFHIFKDDLSNNLDYKLAKATRFWEIPLSNHQIENIIDKVRVSNRNFSENEINLLVQTEEIGKTAIELKEISMQARQLLEAQQINTINKSLPENKETNKGSKSPWIMGTVIVTMFLIFIINTIGSESSNINSGNYVSNIPIESAKVFNNPEFQSAMQSPNNSVQVDAFVEEFRFDNASGTKFLKIYVDEIIYNAVIFEGVKTPYFHRGDKFTFYGKTQEYKGKIELNITRVE